MGLHEVSHKEKRYDLIDAFNSTSRYMDDLLNIDNIYFEHMVNRIYSAELQPNKANASDTEAVFLDLNLSIHNNLLSTQIYDKRDNFNIDIVSFPSLDGDVPRIHLMVYIFTASKVKHHLNIFLEKTVKLSNHDFFLVTLLKRDKVVKIYSKFRFDYHKGKRPGMVKAHLPLKMSRFSTPLGHFQTDTRF